MVNIEISWEAYNQIKARTEQEKITPNQVITQLLEGFHHVSVEFDDSELKQEIEILKKEKKDLGDLLTRTNKEILDLNTIINKNQIAKDQLDDFRIQIQEQNQIIEGCSIFFKEDPEAKTKFQLKFPSLGGKL